MTVTAEQVLAQLRRVKGPDLDGNIVDLGLVSEVLIKSDRAYFSITVPAARATELELLRQAAEKVVADIPGLKGVSAVLTAEATGKRSGNAAEGTRVQAARAAAGGAHSHGPGHSHSHAASAPAAGPAAGKATVSGIKHLIAVASGKGGVGKSTTAVNLALGFKAMGLRVGILDADVYGPSQPRLLGLTGRPQQLPDKTLRPMQAFGLEVMSMGFLVEEDTPVILRAPMVVSALTQMLRQVGWGQTASGGAQDLDVLVIDMPPGTGDVQLSMAQQVPLSGAVIVSTPQDLALIDARKGLAMFQRVDVPVLGIIENMSTFICTKCGEQHDIFGHGGAEAEAHKLGVPFLGGVPLHLDIRVRSDAGQPVTATDPDGPHGQIYRALAARTWAELQASQGRRVAPPVLTPDNGGADLRVAITGSAPFTLPAEMLRVMSPSAEVQGHSPSQRVTVGRKRNVKIKEIQPVGNYAVRLVFDDGHSTGLYAWNYLETLHNERDARWSVYLAELTAKGLSRD